MSIQRHGGRTILALLLILTISASPIYSVVAFASDSPSDWAVSEVIKAYEYGLIPEDMYHSFGRNMNRGEFCKLVMALYTKLTTHPPETYTQSVFVDTNDGSILNAYELGIVKGVGYGYFLPYTSVTRQEIAVMLYNAIGVIDRVLGKDTLKNPSAALTFVDRALMDDWAVTAIMRLRNNEIMLGDNSNRFNPLDNTTKEMAFILVNRIYLIYSGLDAKKSFPAAYSGDVLMRIKGYFISGGAYQVVGDIYETYPDVSISDLSRYLANEIFYDNNGDALVIDRTESLSESVSAGYAGETIAGGKYYPVYVFSGSGAATEKIYLIYDGSKYRFYMDLWRREPYFLKTFSDVIFEVPSDIEVLIDNTGADSDILTSHLSGNAFASLPGGSDYASIPGARVYASRPGEKAYATIPGGQVFASVPGGNIYASIPGSAYESITGGSVYAYIPGGHIYASVPGEKAFAYIPGGYLLSMRPNSSYISGGSNGIGGGVSPSDDMMIEDSETPGGVSLTFIALTRDAPELLDLYMWRIQLLRGKVVGMSALSM